MKQVKHILTSEAYNLSTDYKLLWDLIQKGYRIPAWLIYNNELFDEPVWDIVEVRCIVKYNRIQIGYRGQGYSGFDDTLESLIQTCEHYSLHFVLPSK